MKKYIFIMISLFLFTSTLFSQKIDNIILLDTSMSMFPYYSGTIGYLIEDIVEKQLEPGDGFHLLSFNDFPEYEISRTIKTESELEDILNRILLLQPVGQYTDLIAALSYLYEYVDELPSNSIKKLIILTDGIHDPPPGSKYPLSSDNKIDIIKISENMKRQGWEVSLIQFPIQQSNQDVNTVKTENKSLSNTVGNGGITGSPVDTAGSAGNNLFPDIAETLNEKIVPYIEDSSSLNYDITGAPEIIYPAPLGRVSKEFNVVFTFKNHSEKPVLLKLASILLNDVNIMESGTTVLIEPKSDVNKEIFIILPDNFSSGDYKSQVELVFEDSFRAYPRTGILTFSYDPELKSFLSVLNTRIILYILLALFFLIILIFITIKIINSLNSSSSRGSFSIRNNLDSSTPHQKRSGVNISSKSTIKSLKTDEIVIEMTVLNQNRHIGHRNIHILRNGCQRSVGGAGSEYFLIFIIQTGRRIADLTMENNTIKFIPRAKEYFPDLTGEVLESCLYQPIKVVNKDGIETEIVFREWISPVDKLNKVMHLLDNRGKPDFNY